MPSNCTHWLNIKVATSMRQFCFPMLIGILLGLKYGWTPAGLSSDILVIRLSSNSQQRSHGLTFTAVLLGSSMGSIVLTYTITTIIRPSCNSKWVNRKPLKTCSTHFTVKCVFAFGAEFRTQQLLPSVQIHQVVLHESASEHLFYFQSYNLWFAFKISPKIIVKTFCAQERIVVFLKSLANYKTE